MIDRRVFEGIAGGSEQLSEVVALDLFDKLSPDEYAAFHSDPVLTSTPIPIRKEAVL